MPPHMLPSRDESNTLEDGMTAVHDREIGAQRKRVEDPRLVRGEGQYVDDLRLPGTWRSSSSAATTPMRASTASI